MNKRSRRASPSFHLTQGDFKNVGFEPEFGEAKVKKNVGLDMCLTSRRWVSRSVAPCLVETLRPSIFSSDPIRHFCKA